MNGAWLYRTNGYTIFAYYNKDSNPLTPVNHYSANEHEFVVVPRGMFKWNDYNSAMVWAEQQDNNLTSMCDLLDEDSISKLNEMNQD